MRLLMRNCLKYTQQCQNGISQKSTSGKNGTLISNMDPPYHVLIIEWGIL